MKTQLIKLKDKFILISDEEIKVGDWFYFKGDSTIHFVESSYHFTKLKKLGNKVIAGIPELPQIDWNDLESEFGYVDAEKLFYDKYPLTGVVSVDSRNQLRKEGFIEGFKAAQQLNDKMFSLEDMREAIKLSRSLDWQRDSDGNKLFNHLEKDIIQSLQQTSWDVDVEMEVIGLCDCECHEPGVMVRHVKACCNPTERPKVINGKIKILRKL